MGFAAWNGVQVAIKKIPSAFDDVVDAKRIVREVRLLRRLDHMNIIKIVDILPPPSLADFNDVYIVSELMDTDLHRVIYSSQVSGWGLRINLLNIISSPPTQKP